MPVRQQNGVEAFELNAKRLLAEVRRGINHHVLAAAGNQQGRAQPLIVRIVRLAHAASAAERGKTQGCGGAEYRNFQRSGRHGEKVGTNHRAEPSQTPGVSYGRPLALALASSAATA